MIAVALFEPEIPPNTGNIGRLCAATGAPLHLIGPLGFRIDDRSLRRAGLDYWAAVDLHRHCSLEDFDRATSGRRLVCFSKRGTRIYSHFEFRDDDCLLFGNESSGLPETILERQPGNVVTIPMPTGKVRCLNLATAVGIALYEALRQLHTW